MFDVDGTVAEVYAPIHTEIAEEICALLKERIKVAFVTGRSFVALQKTVIPYLPCFNMYAQNVLLVPASGAALYDWHDGAWREVYGERFIKDDEEDIIERYGQILSTVDPQYSATECRAHVRNTDDLLLSCTPMSLDTARNIKQQWDPDATKRTAIITQLQKEFPHCEFRIGGGTTIDVTRGGIHKGYGVRRLLAHTGIAPEEALYFGDALYPGGNDFDVIETGVATVSVEEPKEVLHILERLREEGT